MEQLDSGMSGILEGCILQIGTKHYKGHSTSLTAPPRMLGKPQSYFCTPAIAHAAITLIRPDSERSTLTFYAGQRKPCEKWDTRTEMQEKQICSANAQAGHASQEGQVQDRVKLGT